MCAAYLKPWKFYEFGPCGLWMAALESEALFSSCFVHEYQILKSEVGTTHLPLAAPEAPSYRPALLA